jgi:hypothetical protein
MNGVTVWEQHGWCVAALQRLMPMTYIATCGTSLKGELSFPAGVMRRFAVFVADDPFEALCAAKRFAHNNEEVPLGIFVPNRTAARWQCQAVWQAWLQAVRQAGAVDVVVSLAELPRLARTIERYHSQLAEPELDLRQAIWRRLPWQG